jgi:tetratricopeptide (TPR) repeat protein
MQARIIRGGVELRGYRIVARYSCTPAVLAIFLCFGGVPEAQATQSASVTRAPVLDQPTWGKVRGWVVDASTRQPIAGARVMVAVDGAFPEKGKSVSTTDPAGEYEVRAPLGKVSRKFDWGRLLTMHPLSLLIAPTSVTKQTRIVDVTQVNARVEASGYQSFVGRVRATLANPTEFSITLDDVWLAPEKLSLASFTPDRLQREVIEELKVEPAVALPGDRVEVTLITRLPLERGHKYRAYLTSTAPRLLETEQELKRDKVARAAPAASGEQGTRATFRRVITLPKKSSESWTELGFILVRNEATALRQRDTRVLLQMLADPADRPAAEKVAEGFARVRLGDRYAALEDCRSARTLRPGYRLAHQFFGDLSLQVNRPADAVQAFRELARLSPGDLEGARSRLIRALVDLGDLAQAQSELTQAKANLGKRLLPAPLALSQARVHAARGEFELSDEWLARAGKEMQIPPEIGLQINLRRMEAAVKTRPNDADLRLSYARVLEDAGQRGEAQAQRRQAVELDASQPWPFIDLGAGLWGQGRREEAIVQFRHALSISPSNLEASLALAGAYRDLGRFADALPLYRAVAQAQPYNLRARHFLGLTHYALGDLPAARRELAETIAQARSKGDLKEEGIPFPSPLPLGGALYFGPKKRLVVGFSVPEATADFAILEALEDLERHPNNGLLWQNIGHALVDLELPALALPALTRSREADPGLLETRFLLGVTLRKLGRTEEARGELQAVVSANPLHPRARLELAQLFTDSGDLERAQAELSAHARNYPHERAPRPKQALEG